jgi:hypothetical protein
MNAEVPQSSHHHRPRVSTGVALLIAFVMLLALSIATAVLVWSEAQHGLHAPTVVPPAVSASFCGVAFGAPLKNQIPQCLSRRDRYGGTEDIPPSGSTSCWHAATRDSAEIEFRDSITSLAGQRCGVKLPGGRVASVGPCFVLDIEGALNLLTQKYGPPTQYTFSQPWLDTDVVDRHPAWRWQANGFVIYLHGSGVPFLIAWSDEEEARAQAGWAGKNNRQLDDLR